MEKIMIVFITFTLEPKNTLVCEKHASLVERRREGAIITLAFNHDTLVHLTLEPNTLVWEKHAWVVERRREGAIITVPCLRTNPS
jgi:hypothetical protein